MNKKVCTGCNELKNLIEFGIRSASKDGKTARCTECLKLYRRERYKKHGKEEYLRYKDSRAVSTHKWREKNPDYIREWRLKNPDYDKLWYEKNKEKCAESTKKWYEKNKYKSHAAAAAYRARKLKNVEELTELECVEIKQIYKKCTYMNNNSEGIKYHVDHIVPLSKGGLHHPDNLQILRAVDNLRKGCKLPD